MYIIIYVCSERFVEILHTIILYCNYFTFNRMIMTCNVGPKPGPPRNVSITEVRNGFVISWQAPLERTSLVRYYVIHYKTDGIWRTLNKAQIRAEDTSYFGMETKLQHNIKSKYSENYISQ